MPSPLIGGCIKRCFCLTSVAYIGPKSTTERPRKTKIDTEVAHITRDSDTTFRVKSQGNQAALLSDALTLKGLRLLQRSAWERIRRGKVLLRCICLAARRHPRGRRGAGHNESPHAQLVFALFYVLCFLCSQLLCRWCYKVKVVCLYSTSIQSVFTALRYSTNCRGITQFYLRTLCFICKQSEPYLPLTSQPQLVLIY